MFHNLIGHDSYLKIQKLVKFGVEIDAIPNGLEKYKAFAVNINLTFINSMQFMNSSLDALVTNLPDNDFKY